RAHGANIELGGQGPAPSVGKSTPPPARHRRGRCPTRLHLGRGAGRPAALRLNCRAFSDTSIAFRDRWVELLRQSLRSLFSSGLVEIAARILQTFLSALALAPRS